MNKKPEHTNTQGNGISTSFNTGSDSVPFFVTINKDYEVLMSHSGQWTPPKGTLTVQVYSLTRSLLLEQDIAIDGTQPQTIEVSSLPADQYYIAVSAKDFPGGYIEAPRVKLAFVNRNGTDIEFEVSNHERKLNIEEIGTDTPTPHHPTLSHRPTTDHNLTPQYDDDLTIDELISRDIELPEEELLSFDTQEDEDPPIRENKIKKDEKRNKKDYRQERVQKQKEQEILERNFVLEQERAEGGGERKGERVGGDSVYDPYNYTSETYDYPHEQDEHTEERTEQYRSVVQTQDKTHEPTVSEKETVQTGHSDYTEPLAHTDEDAYKSKADSYKPSERPSEPEIEHYNHRESTEYTKEQASYSTHKEQPEYDPYNYTSETYDYPQGQDDYTEERTEQYRSVAQTQDKTHEPTVSEKETVQAERSNYVEPLTYTSGSNYEPEVDIYKPQERTPEPQKEAYTSRDGAGYTDRQDAYNTHTEQSEGHHSDYSATSYGESEAIYNEIYKTEEVSVEKPVEPTKANINEHEDKPADTYRDIYDRSFREQSGGIDTSYGLDDKNIYEEDLSGIYGDTQYEDTDKSYATPHYNGPKVQNSEIYDEPSVPTYKEEQTPVHSSETYERQGDDLYSTENATHEAEERPRDERQVSAFHGENQFPIQQSEEYTPKTTLYKEEQAPVQQSEQYRPETAPYREDQPPVHQPEQYRSGTTSSDVNKSTNEHVFPPQDQPRQADVSHKPEGYVSEYRDPDSYTSSYVAREQEYRPASTPHESKTEKEYTPKTAPYREDQPPVHQPEQYKSGTTSSDVNKSTNEHIFPPQDQPRQAGVSHKPEGYASEYRDPDGYTSSYVAREQEYRPASTPHESKTEAERDAPFSFRPTDTQATETNRENVGWKTRQEEIDLRRYVEGERAKARMEGGGERVPVEYSEEGLMDVLRGTMSGYTEDIALTKEDDASVITIKHNEGNDTTRIELRENQNTVVYTTNTIAGPAIAKTVESKINAFEGPYKDASTIYREAETGRVFERHIVEPEVVPTVEEATNRIKLPEWSDEELKARIVDNYKLSDVSIIEKGDQKVIKITGGDHDDIVYSFNSLSRRPEQYNMSEQEKEVFNMVAQYDTDLQAKISAVNLLNAVRETSEREVATPDASYSSLFFKKDDPVNVRKLGNGALIPDAQTEVFNPSRSFVSADYLSSFRAINIYRDVVDREAVQVLRSEILSGRSLDAPTLIEAEDGKSVYDEAINFHRNSVREDFSMIDTPPPSFVAEDRFFGLEQAIEISNRFSSSAKTMVKNTVVNETEAGQGGREIWTRVSTPVLFAAAHGESVTLSENTAAILRASLRGSRLERAFVTDLRNSGIATINIEAVDIGDINLANRYKRQIVHHARNLGIRGLPNMNAHEISESIRSLQEKRLSTKVASEQELIDRQIATFSAYNIINSLECLASEEFTRIMSEAGLLQDNSITFCLSTIEGVRQYERLISEYCRVSGLPDFTKMSLEDLTRQLGVLTGDHRIICEQAMATKNLSHNLRDLSRMQFMARHSLITTIQRLFGNLDAVQGGLMVYRSVNSVMGIIMAGSRMVHLLGRIGRRALKFLHLDNAARKIANKTGINRVRAYNRRQVAKRTTRQANRASRRVLRRRARIDRVTGRVARIQNRALRSTLTRFGRGATRFGRGAKQTFDAATKIVQGIYKGSTKALMFAGKVIAGVLLVGILTHLMGATIESLTVFMPDFIETVLEGKENKLYLDTYNKLIEMDDDWVDGLREDSSKTVGKVLEQSYVPGFYVPNKKGDGIERYEITKFGVKDKDAVDGEEELNKAGYILNFFERANVKGLPDEARVNNLTKGRQISVISNAKQIISCADVYTDGQGLLYKDEFEGYALKNKHSLWAATHRMTYTHTPIYACKGFCEEYKDFKCNTDAYEKMYGMLTEAYASEDFRCPKGSIPAYSPSGCEVHTELSSKTQTRKFYCGLNHFDEKTGEIYTCTEAECKGHSDRGHKYKVNELKDCDEQMFDTSKGTPASATVYEAVPVKTVLKHWDDSVIVYVEKENDNGLDDPYVKDFYKKCSNVGIFKTEWYGGFLVIHYCKGHPNSIYPWDEYYEFEDEINIADDGEEPFMLPVSSYAKKVRHTVFYRTGAYVCQGYCPGHHTIPYCKGHTNLQIDAFITLSMDASIPMGTKNSTNIYTVFQADMDGGTGQRLIEPPVPPLPVPGAPAPEAPTPGQLFSWYPWNTDEAESLDLRLVAQRRFDEDWYSLYGLKTYNEAGIILPQKEISSLLLMAQNNTIKDEPVVYGWGNKEQKSDRLKVINYALNSVGKVPYFFGGYAVEPGYHKDNGFGTVTKDPDHMGRTLKGLDCARWARWVYKSAEVTLKTGLSLDYKGGAIESEASVLFGTGSINSELIGKARSGGEDYYKSTIAPGDILYSEANDHVAIFLAWIDVENMLVIEEVAGSTENVRVGTYKASFWEHAYSWLPDPEDL